MREVQEETHVTLTSQQLEQFRMYSNPGRDPRRHTASMVFRCVVKSLITLKNGDDAKQVKWVKLKDSLNLPLAFDHRMILHEYIQKYHPHLLPK